MTDRFAALVICVILSVFCWTAIAKTVLMNSRQTCEETTSADTCAWEMR